MCLIAFAIDAHPRYAFILGANRDEFYDRPTAPAHFWDDTPGLLAGRDERAGGTWLGVTRSGRFAALTNVRDSQQQREEAPSRGHLVKAFLEGEESPAAYLHRLAGSSRRYNGFNLLAGTFAAGASPALGYFSNATGEEPLMVSPGIHGISNASLNTAWNKVESARMQLRSLLETEEDLSPEAVLEILRNAAPAPEESLPDTGVPRRWERALSSIFIETDSYGTRSSTALLIGRGGEVTFVERSFEEGSSPTDRRFSFQIESEGAEAGA